MYCGQCGNKVTDGSKYCNFCGAELLELSTAKESEKFINFKINIPKGDRLKCINAIILFVALISTFLPFFKTFAGQALSLWEYVEWGMVVIDGMDETAENISLVFSIIFVLVFVFAIYTGWRGQIGRSAMAFIATLIPVAIGGCHYCIKYCSNVSQIFTEYLGEGFILYVVCWGVWLVMNGVRTKQPRKSIFR